MDNHVINAVIECLYKNDHFVASVWLYKYGNNDKAVTDLALVVSELNRLELIDSRYTSIGDEYLLNVPTRRILDGLSSKDRSDPYGYFLEMEKAHHAVSQERLNLELQKLRDEIKDRPTGLRQAKISVIISIVTLTLTLLIILLTRFRIWPFDVHS